MKYQQHFGGKKGLLSIEMYKALITQTSLSNQAAFCCSSSGNSDDQLEYERKLGREYFRLCMKLMQLNVELKLNVEMTGFRLQNFAKQL